MLNIKQVVLYTTAGIGLIAIAGMGVLAILARVVKAPSTLGVRDGRLAPCPNSPNCVSTYNQDKTHGIEPISYATSVAEARERLLHIVRSMERTRIVTAEPTYTHAEFRTKGMGYVDDVEFYLDEDANLIRFRSASRLPYWDWGVNRERMEAIRRAFQATGG